MILVWYLRDDDFCRPGTAANAILYSFSQRTTDTDPGDVCDRGGGESEMLCTTRIHSCSV